MSRFKNMPVVVPEGVTLTVEKNPEGLFVKAKGPKGELLQRFPSVLKVNKEGDSYSFDVDAREHMSFVGLAYRLTGNLVLGVSKGFAKALEVSGVGYRWNVAGKKLNLQLGYSHPVSYEIPADIEIVVGKDNVLTVSGVDKQKVGAVAAKIKSYRPVEPYKGKGVRYQGEYVIRKAGKSGAK